jgi:hypothetical protein
MVSRTAIALLACVACESRPAPDLPVAEPSPAPVRTPAPRVAEPVVPAAPLLPGPASPSTAESPAVGRAAGPVPAREPGAPAPFHWRLDVVRDDAGFRVARALRVAGEMPRYRRGPRGLAWRYRARAADGAVLAEGELDDPAEIRGEFHGERGGIDAVHRTRPLPVAFSIRVPNVPAATIEFATREPAAPLGSVPLPREAP